MTTHDTADLVRQMKEALGLALGDVEWRADSPTMPVLVRAYNAADQWLAKQPAQKQAAPDGWKLVPVEPTPEMISAGECAHWNKERDACSPTPTEFSYDGGGPIGYAWTAMLAAAPQAVAQPLQVTDEWLLAAAGATLYLHHRPAVDRLVRTCADACGVKLEGGV